MDWYHVVLFLHILGALGLFMALAVELTSMFGASRARTVEAVRTWSSTFKPLDIVFPLTTLLLLGAGLFLTFTTWGWGHAWIDFSLAIVLLASIQGPAVNGRYARRIVQHAATLGSGPVPPELTYELNHRAHWTSVMTLTALALGIIVLMTIKPGLLGTIIVVLCALVLGVFLAQLLVRSGLVAAQARMTEADEKMQPAKV